jgi:DNA-binding transcriptional LysR family regulator
MSMAQRFGALDLNLLRVFDEVMATQNITRAATTLAMTQPAVSNALRRLREALGDDLVIRAGYGVTPTPKALALWPTVRDALASLQATITPDAFDASTSKQSFVLAMADATAAMLMPALIRQMESSAPHINIRVLPLTTRDPRALLDGGEVDLAVGHFPAVVTAIALEAMQTGALGALSTFTHQQLYSGQYVCVMRRDHPLASKRLTIDAYCSARHLLVSFSGRPFGFIDEALAALQRTRRIVLTVNQFFTAGRVVVGSDLLTVLPRHFLPSTGMSAELAVSELPFAVPKVQVDMVWHQRTRPSAAQQWLRSALNDAAKAAFMHAKSPSRRVKKVAGKSHKL